ncbi:MAG TPA: LuxR C-terminal-related transcriptional regulator [Streptosporangiaceae bacterium]
MEPGVQPGPADDLAASVGGGVVARRELFRRLDSAGRITEVSAPAGSGKTVLLRSWIGRASLAERAAWVPVTDREHDPQGFWIAVADALRGTRVASGLVRPLTPAPNRDGWTIVEQLLKDLARLEDQVWLAIDDVHELTSDALRQLELLALRAPPELRLVLATRHDLRLGMHRLRLEGELTEIRAADLRLTLAEARALFEGAGVTLPDTALALLHTRTEGWAAGLRLAALSLAGHPDPERFAAEFSGRERTVAGYLLAEVLERQSEPVRRLLLRTSVLERVSGELADLLTGGSGAERMLQDLERAGAFVVSLDAHRSWFRYHHLFADLLRLELQGTAPTEVPELHRVAARWFAGHGFPVEAVRHAQAAQDWGLAARLLSDHWVSFYLDGQGSIAQGLLAAFPAEEVAIDAELATLKALGELNAGSLEEVKHYLARAARELDDPDGPVPAERRARLRVFLSVVGLRLAVEHVDPQAVAEEAGQLLAPAETVATGLAGLGADLRALVLVNLGAAEAWGERLDDADRHLGQGVALARRIGQPYVEVAGLAFGARVATFQSMTLAEQRSRQAIELAGQHGWDDEWIASFAYSMLGGALTGQGRLVEAEPWLDRAGLTLQSGTHPGIEMNLCHARGLLEMARGRHREALAELQAADRLADRLITPDTLTRPIRALTLLAHVELSEAHRAEVILARLDEQERQSPQLRVAVAALRLAQHEPQAAVAALAPALDGSIAGIGVQSSWAVGALLLESAARDGLAEMGAAWHALERALKIAEPGRMFIPFLLHPLPELLERHARRATAHAGLIDEILRLLRGESRAADGRSVHEKGPGRIPPPEPKLRELLSQAEMRVLRYLPTSLSIVEIADELYLSANTVRTHMRHLYTKLDVHARHEAVERARAIGLLAPVSRRP